MILQAESEDRSDHTQQESGVGPLDKLRPALLTVLEACQVLRISRWTLYVLIRARAIETIKIGRSRRIPLSSISQYIRRRLKEDIE